MNPQLTPNPPSEKPLEDFGEALHARRRQLACLETLTASKDFQAYQSACLMVAANKLQSEALNVKAGTKDTRDLAAQKASQVVEIYNWPKEQIGLCRSDIERMEEQVRKEKAVIASPLATPPGF